MSRHAHQRGASYVALFSVRQKSIQHVNFQVETVDDIMRSTFLQKTM